VVLYDPAAHWVQTRLAVAVHGLLISDPALHVLAQRVHVAVLVPVLNLPAAQATHALSAVLNVWHVVPVSRPASHDLASVHALQVLPDALNSLAPHGVHTRSLLTVQAAPILNPAGHDVLHRVHGSVSGPVTLNVKPKTQAEQTLLLVAPLATLLHSPVKPCPARHDATEHGVHAADDATGLNWLRGQGSHVVPGPENPALQKHMYEPIVFTHVAVAAQLFAPAHSFLSLQAETPLPV
jgi:hypothetical protein